jgi:TusA-related sulfurtransferase
MSPTRIDVSGLTCSDAVVRLHKAITPLREGARVHITADDWAVLVDLKQYASRGGHTWVAERKDPSGTYEVEVRRGA